MENRLEDLRTSRDLKKFEIAKIIGVVPSIYCEWENDRLAIPTKRLYKLAEFFEINIDYMLRLDNNKRRIKKNTNLNRVKVANNLRELRKDINISMREEAKMLNTTSSVVSNFENNKTLILGTFLVELCKKTNYSIDWVLGRSDIKKININNKASLKNR